MRKEFLRFQDFKNSKPFLAFLKNTPYAMITDLKLSLFGIDNFQIQLLDLKTRIYGALKLNTFVLIWTNRT